MSTESEVGEIMVLPFSRWASLGGECCCQRWLFASDDFPQQTRCPVTGRPPCQGNRHFSHWLCHEDCGGWVTRCEW